MNLFSHHFSFDDDRYLIYLSILYLLFPIMLFGFGWLKSGYAILFFLILIFSTQQTFKKITKIHTKALFNNISLVILFITILILWVLLSGIGGVGYQGWDYHGRNALLHDLIAYDWPVKFDFSSQPEMSPLFGSGGYLVYYIGFFLPAALFGKFFGWQLGNFFLIWWSVFGVVLSMLLIFRYLKKASMWIVITFIFFSGMDVLGAFKSFSEVSNLQSLFLIDSFEWWAVLFQYSSFTTQLFNVFNQCVPAWIVSLLIISEKKPQNILFYFSLLLMYAPLPIIGLIPVLIYKFFKISCQYRKKLLDIHKFNKFDIRIIGDWFTFQNLAGAGSILLVGFLFLSANAVGHENGFIWKFHPELWSLILVYLLFCLLEFLILGVVLLPLTSNKKQLVFVLLFLLIIPLFKYGQMNDFSMRVSIPLILSLYLIMMKALLPKRNGRKNRLPVKLILVAILFIGSINPLYQISRSFYSIISNPLQANDEWKSFAYGGYIDKMDTLPNFVIRDNPTPFFFKYLGK